MGSNNNCEENVASYAAQYVENYLDFVQNIPDDVQRHITQLREIDVEYQEILRELDQLWECLHNKQSDSTSRRRTLLQAQNAMIKAQELGDSKLQIWQIIQDMIENKARSLEVDFKKLDLGRENEVHNENHKCDAQPERTSKRSRRQGHVDLLREDSVHEKPEKEMPAPSVCKKQKKKKRKAKVEKEQVASPFEPPIDPDEPTYCLCDQVSYGEMICCDNQSCPREWFHFSCVGLNFKPKGKWYCPKCRGERSNQMRPQASWPPSTRYCICDRYSLGVWIACDNKDCPTEWYHIACVGLKNIPEGEWICPSCKTDFKNTINQSNPLE